MKQEPFYTAKNELELRFYLSALHSCMYISGKEIMGAKRDSSDRETGRGHPTCAAGGEAIEAEAT